MAMSALKQQPLKIEFAQIGLYDAEYKETVDVMRTKSPDDRMPKIYDNGDIHYGTDYDHLVTHQIQAIVNRVNELTAAWEKALAVPFEGLSRYRILSEYNNIVLAARDDSEKGFGYGFEFATWKYTRDRTDLERGNYTTDYETAKQDFAVRCGLVDSHKLFNETVMKLIRQGLVYLGADFPDLTNTI